MAFCQELNNTINFKSIWDSDKLDQLHLYISLLPLHQHHPKNWNWDTYFLLDTWDITLPYRISCIQFVCDHSWVHRIPHRILYSVCQHSWVHRILFYSVVLIISYDLTLLLVDFLHFLELSLHSRTLWFTVLYINSCASSLCPVKILSCFL